MNRAVDARARPGDDRNWGRKRALRSRRDREARAALVTIVRLDWIRGCAVFSVMSVANGGSGAERRFAFGTREVRGQHATAGREQPGQQDEE